MSKFWSSSLGDFSWESLLTNIIKELKNLYRMGNEEKCYRALVLVLFFFFLLRYLGVVLHYFMSFRIASEGFSEACRAVEDFSERSV